MSLSEFWKRTKISKWGKYVVTVAIFLVVYLFIGDQSMVHFIKRGREIRRMEQQRDNYREATDRAQQEMQALHQPDSLERFAREQYYMHEQNEDIYLVEE